MVFIFDTHKMKVNITMMPSPTAFKHSSRAISYLQTHYLMVVLQY
jgi:hypothetical protein